MLTARPDLTVLQSYPDTLGTPGTGVKLSVRSTICLLCREEAYRTSYCQGVNFVGSTNSISVVSGAKRVAVNCGSGACSGMCPLSYFSSTNLIARLACIGNWDWSALKVSGGSAGTMNYSGIKNFSQ